MASQSKLTKDRNQKVILELASQPGNNACADCKSSMPRWASANLGIFICVNCATIHRKIGTHVTKVKSLTMDDWTKDQVDHMRAVGNIRSNALYNPNELRFPPPPNIEDPERDSEMEHYVRAKYQYKKFVDRNAFVASRLGPSASVASRSVSTPVTNPASQQERAPPPAKPFAPAPKAEPALKLEPQESKLPAASLPSAARSSSGQPRSVSQPLTTKPTNGSSVPAAPSGGVWNDINLINQSVNASLPLQYQAPQATGLPQSASMPMFSMNSTMQQNAPLPGFSSAPTLYSGMTGANTFAPNGYSQQLNLQQPTGMGQYFQSSVPQQQIATPTAMYSPSPQTMGGMTLTPSPNQFISVPGQNQFLSPSPSQQFFSASPSQHQQFLSPSPGQQHMSMTPQIASPYSSTPSSAVPTGGFLGMTTMQMEQQRYQQQQQQMQQQQMQQMQMQAQAQFQFQQQQQRQQQQQQMYMQQQAYGTPQWGAM